MSPQQSAYFERLYEAVLQIKTQDECRSFFEDICTINELISISQRLKVAELLNEGRSFADISAETGASTTTISRVNRSYVYGSGGYNKIIERLPREDN